MTSRSNWPRGESFHIQTASGPLNCRIDGRAGAPSILFSNSHATDMSLWTHQVATLADGFNVIRYDQRGHGATPVSNGRITFDSLADDIITVLDALDVETATLVGVSMGAVTVLRCAARHPRRIARVLASDGQWAAPSGAHQMWEERIGVALGQGMQALIEPTIQRWFTPASLNSDAEPVLHARRMIGATSKEGYANCARAMQDYDFRSDFAQLRMPVQYVVGEQDGKLPVVMQEMSDATPYGRFTTIANAGHLPCLERAHEFNALLSSFITTKAKEFL